MLYNDCPSSENGLARQFLPTLCSLQMAETTRVLRSPGNLSSNSREEFRYRNSNKMERKKKKKKNPTLQKQGKSTVNHKYFLFDNFNISIEHFQPVKHSNIHISILTPLFFPHSHVQNITLILKNNTFN